VPLGVTAGYHRTLTHRSFVPNPVVKTILLILGSMALEGDALQWAATHQALRAGRSPRRPHSPIDGLLHAHVGWIFAETDAEPQRYVKHLLQDRLIMFISPIWTALLAVRPCGLHHPPLRGHRPRTRVLPRIPRNASGTP
jgi:stearoyl-CoA desaturase (delta-9 desaturase)